MIGTKTMKEPQKMGLPDLIRIILNKEITSVCVAVLGTIIPSIAALLSALGTLQAPTTFRLVFVLSVPVQDSYPKSALIT
jgi:hypothetical protein